MRVLHTSDLHGRYHTLLDCTLEFDLWLDTGDFLPTHGRGTSNVIDAYLETRHQIRQLGYSNLPNRVRDWLQGKPALLLPGNHDFVSFEPYLRRAGATTYEVTPTGVDLLGFRWAGFREIPWIDGEWKGESHDLSPFVQNTLDSNPDILVTHAPPGGILDEEAGYGIPCLTSALCYREHKIQAHFFGHCHQDGGKTQVERDINFYNGAERATIITL